MAHLGNVDAEIAVDARALDADEDAEIDRGPVRVLSTAVGTPCVVHILPQLRQRLFLGRGKKKKKTRTHEHTGKTRRKQKQNTKEREKDE